MTSSSPQRNTLADAGDSWYPEPPVPPRASRRRSSAWVLVPMVALVMAAAGFAIDAQVSSSSSSPQLMPTGELDALEAEINGAVAPASTTAVRLASVAKAVRPQLVVIN